MGLRAVDPRVIIFGSLVESQNQIFSYKTKMTWYGGCLCRRAGSSQLARSRIAAAKQTAAGSRGGVAGMTCASAGGFG